MSILFIVFMLFLGIILILLEIIVFPGVSIPGILGIVLLSLGIYYSYIDHGHYTGNIVLLGTVLIGVLSTVLALRYGTWKRIALNKELTEKIEKLKGIGIENGSIGITVSRLSPIGSVKINNHIIEAKSKNGYIDEKVSIKIVRIKNNEVWVARTNS